MSDTKVEKPGEGEPSPNPEVETVEKGTAEASITMPEGCRCSLTWRMPDDSEGFTWNYLTICPVPLGAHPTFRPLFQTMLTSGSGGGQAPGGARLMINDGKVSVSFRLPAE